MEQQKNKGIAKQKKKINGQSLLEEKDKEIKKYKKIDRYVELLENEKFNVRKEAHKALMEQGDLGYILASAWDKEWFEEFGGDYEKAVEMAKSLKGEEQEKLIEYLLSNEFVGSRFWDVRRDIIKFIREVELKDERIIDVLVKSLKDEKNVRKAAAEALGQLGVANDKVIDGLVGALGDIDWKVREAAARALGKIAKENGIEEEIVERVIELLESENWKKREGAARALGQLGVANNKVIDGLVGALGDKNEDVRRAAVEALKKITEQDLKAEERIKNWKLFMKGLEECGSSKVRVIKELL